MVSSDHISPATPPSVEDAYRHLHVIPNPDGSLTRLNQPPTLPPNSDPQHPAAAVALSKDVPLNPSRNTFIRLFRPATATATAARDSKLPLIIYFHGGGFILLSADTSFFHNSCGRIAAHVPAVVASVGYRLAPEHRLPAAYDDAMDAISWAAGGGGGDPWLTELVDFSRVFLMGSSAGGNIVYHAALRAVDLDLQPMKIVGLVMNEAFFGGVRRTESELRHKDDRLVPLHVSDLMWQLALPEGADRGHEYSDVSATAGDERIGRLPACAVRGYGGDPLVDRERELADILEKRGVKVTRQFVDGGHHAIELFDENFAEKLYNDIKNFVASVDEQNSTQTAAVPVVHG